jgi:hypothetical protein
MWRAILAVVAGLVVWVAVATLLTFGLRWWLPGYQAAEPAMAFTMAMMVARLSLAAVASLAAGALARAIAPSWWVPALVGIIGLALFVPEHIRLWDKFPVWYHLTFLITLVPLVMLGGRLAGGRRNGAA